MLRRLSIVTLAAFGFAIPACDCTGGPAGGGGRASIVARFAGGTSVESDGSSRLGVSLTALDANHKADKKAITITAPTGFVAVKGDANLVRATLSAEPSATGTLDFDFVCDANAQGVVALGVDNGDAKATINVTCVQPQGAVLFAFVDSPECQTLQADGETVCAVDVNVVQDAAIPIPQSTVSVGVKTVAPLNGGDPPDDKVLGGTATSTANNVPIAVTLDATGSGTFFITAPNVAELITLELASGNATTTHELAVGSFSNRAAISFSGANDVVGGSATVIKLTVKGANGAVPTTAHDTAVVSIAGDAGATISAVGVTPDPVTGALTVTLDPVTGDVDITVQTPTVNAGEKHFTLNVSYTFLNAFAPLQGSFNLTANVQGALILNITATPTQIRSDIVASSTTDLLIQFTKDDASVANGTVDLEIGNGDSARIAFKDVNGTPIAAPDTATSIQLVAADFTTGQAHVTVAAVTNAASGVAHVTGLGSDTVQQKSDDLVINVDRAPILQTIQPLPPVPDVIGVRGGALPSSSVVQFKLLDDDANPMPNVPVTFATPTTADRNISVGGSDISDAGGIVQTVLSAGTIAGPVVVDVTATPVSPDPNVGQLAPLTVQSLPIVIVGGLPNFQNSFMACGPAINNREGEIFQCTITLVDRFTEVVPGQPVQFRAEGSGTLANSVTDAAGGADAALTLDDGDTRSAASVPAWSYNFVPLQSQVPGFAGCFDGTVTTPCNLIDLCTTFPQFCPMPNGCLQDVKDARDIFELGIQADDASGAIDEYVQKVRSCGFPVACLLGNTASIDGILTLPGDECPVNIGCMDYSATTQCPQDGLITVLASTRGEESFSDGNGDGIFDFLDGNGNGRQDANERLIGRPQTCVGAPGPGRCDALGNTCTTAADCNTACAVDTDCRSGAICIVTPDPLFEARVTPSTCNVPIDTFVDLPEPFLDKNDNCFRDDMTNVFRLRFEPATKVKHTDPFSDVDNNDVFGFTQGARIIEKNGVWDPDTETFLAAHVLVVDAPLLRFGTPCTPGTAGCIEAPGGAGGVNPSTLPTQLPDNGSFTIEYFWTDVNGNCPSPGFALRSSAVATGPLKIAGEANQDLTDLACGFAAITIPLEPYCEELPVLGPVKGTLTVAADCTGVAQPTPSKIEWALGTAVQSFQFTTLCP